MADRDKEGWEVEKWHLSEDLASESEGENHPSRARREAAGNKKAKKKPKENKQIDKKKQLPNASLVPEKISKSLANHTNDTAALGITQNLTRFVLRADKKSIFKISAQKEETEKTINSNRD